MRKLRILFPIFGAVAIAGACGGKAKPAGLPHADLIVATADSSYWVTSTPHGLRVRGAPMLLARVDGRFHEIYVADDDHSYYDAVLVGQRLWARDLVRGDSVELFADSTVPHFAALYGKTHPQESPLGKNDETSDRPSVTVTAELEVLGVYGPYISYEYRTDMDVFGERTTTDRHTARRGVLDSRTGKAVTVAELFGVEAAGRAERDANAQWSAARDSLLALRGGRARRAQRAVASFAFDSRSFTIESRDGQPQVVYAVPGEISRGAMSAFELDPRDVPPTSWWYALRDELPAGSDSLLRWKHRGLELNAASADNGDVARLTLRDAMRREWRVAAVTAPIWRVLWLDTNVNASDRKALVRAFNDASMYSDETRIAIRQRRRTTPSLYTFAAARR